MKLLLQFVLLFHITYSQRIESSTSSRQPNFIFILSDDLGFNDVGFQNPDVLSPNIDALANEGLILSQHYVQPLCTPSRAAFLTGMYPIHTGRQGFVINFNVPTGLTLERKLLPQYLKDVGYSTHLVGKWHLGFCKDEYTPTNRGFDTYYGFWNGGEDYNTKIVANGFDFHDGEDTLDDDEVIRSTYSTHLYRDRIIDIIDHHSSSNTTNPLFLYAAFQAPHTPHNVPDEYEELYPHIHSPLYKRYYAMITAMDEAIGEMIAKLKEVGMYENTVIVFSGDNGAPAAMPHSNLPLAGFKGTVFEGGTRSAAFIHSPLLKNTGVNEKLIHITDWFPTFLSLAGLENIPDDIDGVNQVDVLFGESDLPPARQEMVYNIRATDDAIGSTGAFRMGKWKLGVNLQLSLKNYLLYDLENDPNETTNVLDDNPEIFQEILERYNAYVATMVPEDQPDIITDGYIVDGSFITGWC